MNITDVSYLKYTTNIAIMAYSLFYYRKITKND